MELQKLVTVTCLGITDFRKFHSGFNVLWCRRKKLLKKKLSIRPIYFVEPEMRVIWKRKLGSSFIFHAPICGELHFSKLLHVDRKTVFTNRDYQMGNERRKTEKGMKPKPRLKWFSLMLFVLDKTNVQLEKIPSNWLEKNKKQPESRLFSID